VNYSMSSKNLVFSHQREVVLALSQFFETVEVFTTEPSSEYTPKNVKVSLLPWRVRSPLRNLLTVLRVVYPFLIKNRDSVLFTHMTDAHAAILAPLAWLIRIRHILWYAHAANSKFLIWSSFFVSNIVSSTNGSCNLRLNKEKICYINQGISNKNFPFKIRSNERFRKVLYYGRLDPSKNIHLFPSLLLELNRSGDIYTLDIFGRPANLESEKYFLNVRSSNQVKIQESSINFRGSIERALVSKVTENYDIFLNLFSGSLDKTLVEATFMGMPVVTWNLEYCSQFGTWSNLPASATLDFIIKEFEALDSMKNGALQGEIARRLNLAIKSHSFEGWIDRLVRVLKKGKLS
jgi:glycosyltransferase involved in cell wall biosynthesis